MKERNIGSTVLMVLRRTLLVIVTVALVLVFGLFMILNTIFRGPSESAINVLTMSLLEASATKWVPGLFLGAERVEQIRAQSGAELPSDISVPSGITINLNANSDEWKNYPDGIRIETVKGASYTAHVMIIRDPSTVYMATSTDPNSFSTSIPGTRIHNQIETEGAIAAINAGAFNDDGTSNPYVGSVPIGLVVAEGEIWDDGSSYSGFVGFNKDNILVVAKSMDAKTAKEMQIRDGCCFGPVLIMNGEINTQIGHDSNSGYNPRTAIGQRADGAVLFVCIDGRQVGSLGGTYADLIDIMVEYGAVNACNLDGGSSSVMLYRDTYGRYGDDRKHWGNDIAMINNYSLLQQDPRRMPTFFMVRPAKEAE